MPKSVRLSIIMPVYNVEKYVAAAIKSVIAQTFTDWELIVVNDGTKDNSMSICEESIRHLSETIGTSAN